MTGKEVIAKLKAAGWAVDRIHGSHHILTKGGQAVRFPSTALAILESAFLQRSNAEQASS